jgi:hypothetical protein
MDRDERMLRPTLDELQRNLMKVLNTLDGNDTTFMNRDTLTPNDETQGIHTTQNRGLQETMLGIRSPQLELRSGQREAVPCRKQSVIDDIANRRVLARQESVSSLDSNKIRKNVRRASRKRPSSQLPLKTEINLETPIISRDDTRSVFSQ